MALGVPKGGLAEVQALLLFEADGDVFWGPLRGERALMDRLFTNLRAGVVLPSTMFKLTGALRGPPPSAPLAWAVDTGYRPFLPNDHAVCLETMTQMYAVRTLPDAKQRAAFKAIPIPPAGPGTQITHLLLPAIEKLHDASLRHKALMRCAGTALAVERCRQARGCWPESLAELPKELLRSIPLDPFDGQPLKYTHRLDWGVTVYSVGYDETDNGGAVGDRPSTEAGTDLGFRLFSVDQRGLPPAERASRPVGLTIRGMTIDGDPVPPVTPIPREVGQPAQLRD